MDLGAMVTAVECLMLVEEAPEHARTALLMACSSCCVHLRGHPGECFVSYCSGSLRKLQTTLLLLLRALPMAQNDCPERGSSVILPLSNCVRALAHPITEHRVSALDHTEEQGFSVLSCS